MEIFILETLRGIMEASNLHINVQCELWTSHANWVTNNYYLLTFTKPRNHLQFLWQLLVPKFSWQSSLPFAFKIMRLEPLIHDETLLANKLIFIRHAIGKTADRLRNQQSMKPDGNLNYHSSFPFIFFSANQSEIKGDQRRSNYAAHTLL